MATLLISSVLLAPALIGLVAARTRRSRTGLRRAVGLAVAFNAGYALSLIYLYFKLQ